MSDLVNGVADAEMLPEEVDTDDIAPYVHVYWDADLLVCMSSPDMTDAEVLVMLTQATANLARHIAN